MTDSEPNAAPLPTVRSCPFDPPDDYARLRVEEPVSRLAMPGEQFGWLASTYDDVRAVLTDPRFSSKWDHMQSPTRYVPPEAKAAFFGQPGMFLAMDPPEHNRYRKLFTGQFTVRRIKALTPKIEEIVNECLDAVEAAGSPADLIPLFALPVPSLVIAELFGVPEEQRNEFQELAATLMRIDLPVERLMQVRAQMLQLIEKLIESKRENPTEDIFSWLINDPTEDLSQEELMNIGLMLLVAGHETTATAIGLGVYALLEKPDQLAALKDHPELMDSAMDELLRYLPIVKFGVTRVATEDIELNGKLIGKNETVVASLPSANRDAAQYTDPDVLDVTRVRTGHVAFGYGVHQCSGQHLTRLEMKVAFTELFRRFPDLRLGVPADEIVLREDTNAYGVHTLPIAWG